jgi:hypothetical protein
METYENIYRSTLREGVGKEEVFEAEELEKLGDIDAKDTALAKRVRELVNDLDGFEDKAKRKEKPIWQRTYFIAWEMDEGHYFGEEIVITFNHATSFITVETRPGSRSSLP